MVADVATGAGAHGVTVDPTGRFAYVTNTYANTLAVVDLATLRTVARVPTGGGPNGVSFSTLAPAPGGVRDLGLGQMEMAPSPGGEEHDSHH